jgi:putative Ca2+/H+ antiporter (TMEM165/GDT1 family)
LRITLLLPHDMKLAGQFLLACVLLAASVAAKKSEIEPEEDGPVAAAAVNPASWEHLSGSTTNSFAMILATEIGDKTFCIAALMAMRSNRRAVAFGGISALVVMTILSIAIGMAVPSLLPKQYTHYAAAVLFAGFGLKMLWEARTADATGFGEEMAEAEAALASEDKKTPGAAATSAEADSSADVEERGEVRSRKGVGPSPPVVSPVLASASATSTGQLDGSLQLKRDWAVVTQAFTITFLAEWGDRSQIGTIAMAAAQNPFGGALCASMKHHIMAVCAFDFVCSMFGRCYWALILYVLGSSRWPDAGISYF